MHEEQSYSATVTEFSQLAEYTRMSYRQEIRHVSQGGGREPFEVTAGDLRNWLLGRIEKGLALGSVIVTAAVPVPESEDPP